MNLKSELLLLLINKINSNILHHKHTHKIFLIVKFICLLSPNIDDRVSLFLLQ